MDDVRDETAARRLVLAYWRHYAGKALAAGDNEALARIHNGGPNGYERPATATYWQKVQDVMAHRLSFRTEYSGRDSHPRLQAAREEGEEGSC